MEPGWGGKAPLERAAVFDYFGSVNTAHVAACAAVATAAAPAAARVTASAAVTPAAAPAAARVTAIAAPPLSP